MFEHAVPRPLWADEPDTGPSRPALRGARTADVAIVGAGFTGLWSAYYLHRRDPTLDIRIVEAEHVGFGASGRNGGWCSAVLPMSLATIAREHGERAAHALQTAMDQTVAEVGEVIAGEGIECGWAQAGYLHAARSGAQVDRLRHELEEDRALGTGAAVWLEPVELSSRLRVPGVLGAVYTPQCAALDPGRLVRGLGAAVERQGTVIHEHSRVAALSGTTVETAEGTLRARHVIRATEAFTARLPAARRHVVPIYSLMVATEPLSCAAWEEIGWTARETFNDARRLIVYAQRTEDGRIAFGGRGAPYHFGSRIQPSFDRDDGVHAALVRALHELFPASRSAAITHRWGGPLGVPRDWQCSIGVDPTTGLGHAGGYVGDGVATSNLAGRILAELLTDAGELSRLPLVGHRSPLWEPEPVRWLSVRSALGLTRLLDALEGRGWPMRTPAWILDRVTGG